MPSKAGVKAGDAFIVISAVDKTAMVMKRISAKMKGFANRMQSMGQQMLTKSIAALIPVGFAVKSFADFDDALKKVEARSDGTAQSMEELRSQAKELGRTTSFTAVQVGDLQAKLAQKGFDRKAIKDMTDDVLALARAAGEGGEEDAVMSADLISGTMRAFQMEASEAQRIADVFTTAVNNSNFSLEGLLDGMSKAGPLSADFGMSLEETVATLASMTNLNISASESGTALQSFLARMSKGEFTGKFNKGLEKMGKSAVKFRNAEGDLRKPLDLMKEIGEITKDLGTAERGDLLSILFGVRQFGKATGAARGAVDALELLNKLEKESQGEAKKTAEIMDSGLGGSFRKLMSAVEGVKIAIGEALSGPLQGMGKFVVNMLNGFAEWIEKNQGLVVAIVGSVAAIGGLGLGLVAVAAAIKLAAIGVGVLGTALTILKGLLLVLISPFGLVVLAITGVGVALYKFSDEAREIMDGIAGFFSEKLGGIASTVTDTFSGIIDAIAVGDLQAAWEILGQGITTTWLQVVDTLASAWEGFATFFIEAWEGAKMAVLQTWFSIQKSIATGILRLAEDAGILGEAMDVIIGTDVSETKAKADDLEQQRQQILRNRLRTLQDERQALMGQKEAGRPVPTSAIQNLDAQIADLKNSLGKLNDTWEDTIDQTGAGFDDKIDQAAVDAGKNLAKWNDRVGANQKGRQDAINTEKQHLKRMLENIKAKRSATEAEKALEETDKQVKEEREEMAKKGGPATTGLPGVNITPSQALEAGSVAAAQKIAEIQFREGTQQKILEANEETNVKLEDQLVVLQHIEENFRGV